MPAHDALVRPIAGGVRAGRRVRRLAIVVGVLALCTLISAAIERYFEPANLITVYLAGVVYVALRHGQAAAIGTVVGSVVLFDLLFVAPRWSLKPADPQYFFSFAVMLLVGLVIGQLAARTQRHAAAVEARARRTQALNQLALELARARTGESVATALAAMIQQVLGAHAQLLRVGDDGRLPDPGAAFADDLAEIERALRERRDTGAGTATDAHTGWRYIPLLAADGPRGILAVRRTPALPDSADDLDLLRAAASQAAVALERAVFEQRGARAAVEAERERLRNTLLAGISHDYRTPLTTIVGSATSLLEQRDAIDEAHRDALLRGILLEAQRMHALSSDLLDLTRMEEGAVRPAPEWCPADELVDEARAALGARLAAHRLTVDADGRTVVWCDPRLVGQALVNMLDNAVRHTPAGGAIRVAVTISAGAWHLVVHDSGPGMAPGQEREVFKKFFRGGQPPDSRGTGLGLAICAVVAELHGGTVTAVNDRGARLEMILPQPDDSATRIAEAE